MATLILVHSSSTGNEEILLNSDRIVSATSSTKKGGGYTTSVKMAGQEGVISITESLGDLVSMAHRRLEET